MSAVMANATDIKVVKFGGSSLADAVQFGKVRDIVLGEASRRYVVPSAPGKRFSEDIKVTDMLYECWDKASVHQDFTEKLKEVQSRYEDIIRDLGLSLSLENEFLTIRNNLLAGASQDYAASRGEYLNGIVLANYLGYEFLDPVGCILFDQDGRFDLDATTEVLGKRLEAMGNVVIPGFYGSYYDGRIKTFSRGGSDITGSIVARTVNASLYENWTDVSGFMVCDPRVITNPETIDTVTYQELRELSYMGATVLHEDAIFPVRTANIPINIRNTNDPAAPGTMIVADAEQFTNRYIITGIAGRKGFVTINVDKDMMNTETGFGYKMLSVLASHHISFEHLPSGIDTMSAIVNKSYLENGVEEQVVRDLYETCHPDRVEIEHNIALIAVVGRGMRQTRGTAARVFAALAHYHINVKMIDQGSSEMNIIVGIAESDFEEALRAIYEVFVMTNL